MRRPAFGQASVPPQRPRRHEMEVHPLLRTVEEGDPHQRIGNALARRGIAHDPAQLGVQNDTRAGPVDAGMSIREVESHQFGEGVLAHLLTRDCRKRRVVRPSSSVLPVRVVGSAAEYTH